MGPLLGLQLLDARGRAFLAQVLWVSTLVETFGGTATPVGVQGLLVLLELVAPAGAVGAAVPLGAAAFEFCFDL
ncbi:hypothetical protein ACFYO9_32480 [Streptomyces sp. NPDC005863]|uniref:hypothetical protein n=1 Tax=unclassified Streptomyces TaxID=2593676 RepID=UPI0033F9F997